MLLRGVVVVDARSILRADIVALAHALRGIVVLPKDLEQILVADRFRIEDDQYHFGVSRHSAAHFAVRGVRRVAGGITHSGRIHTRKLPKLAFGAPETPH